MKKLNYLFSMVILLCLFANCSKSNEDDSSSLDVIQPLKVGYTWTYIDSSFTNNGAFYRADSSKLAITGTTSILVNNKSVQVYYWSWYDFVAKAYGNNKWLVNNEKGLAQYGVTDADSTYVWDPILSFKYPVSANENWTHVDYIITTDVHDSIVKIEKDTVNTTCISINTYFQTAIGSIKCHEYSQASGGYVLSYFFALNKGLVGMVQKKNNVVLLKKTLKSYSLVANDKIPSVKSSRVSRGSNGINLWGVRR